MGLSGLEPLTSALSGQPVERSRAAFRLCWVQGCPPSEVGHRPRRQAARQAARRRSSRTVCLQTRPELRRWWPFRLAQVLSCASSSEVQVLCHAIGHTGPAVGLLPPSGDAQLGKTLPTCAGGSTERRPARCCWLVMIVADSRVGPAWTRTTYALRASPGVDGSGWQALGRAHAMRTRAACCCMLLARRAGRGHRPRR